MATSDLRSWALKGAEQRLVEIQEETQVIFRTFPELRQRADWFRLPKVSRGVGEGAEAPVKATPRRRRRKMSLASRRAVSARMKKYWAERRKSNKK
jgi:hypothetical protein